MTVEQAVSESVVKSVSDKSDLRMGKNIK